MELTIRRIERRDAAVISAAFAEIGWDKPASQYERYCDEQESGERDVLVAIAGNAFAGYVTIHWRSEYEPFATEGIPEIEDFNVLPDHRKRGIGTALMDRAEALVAERSQIAGIGVGMYADYGAAQRLYVQRGYVPDGRGLTYSRKTLPPMETAVNDDNLALYFTKKLGDKR